MENPRYKNLYFNPNPPTTVKKTSAMGMTEAPKVMPGRPMPSCMTQDVLDSKNLERRRAKNKLARKARKVNKKNRRK